MILQNSSSNTDMKDLSVSQNSQGKSNSFEIQVFQVIKDQQAQRDSALLAKWRDEMAKLYFSNQPIKKYYQIQQELDREMIQQLRACLPFQWIIHNKLNSLKMIHIQYTSYQLIVDKYKMLEEKCRYSISAFEFFKVVHENKQLSEIIVKGAQMELFQQFLEQMAVEKGNKVKSTENKTAKHDWMVNFNPLKSLKLTLNTQLLFQVPKQQQTFSRLSNFVFFQKMFDFLSDITVKIKIIDNTNNNTYFRVLNDLLKELRKIRKIKIKIQQQKQVWGDNISVGLVPAIRAQLFGGLSLFTQIAQLSLQGMKFSQNISRNQFLAIQQSLITLFENNQIKYLKLYECLNFPLFPRTTTLESIYFRWISFHRKYDLTREVIQTNRLKRIRCENIKQQCRIDEQLFNQLEVLVIDRCNFIRLDTFSQASLSRIKQLIISQINIEGLDALSVLLGKLYNLKYLQTSQINFKGQDLLTIPSLQLEELHIWANNAITNQGFKLIDQKWAELRRLTFYYCYKITENIVKICEFRGLIEVITDDRMKLLLSHALKSKGIRVN